MKPCFFFASSTKPPFCFWHLLHHRLNGVPKTDLLASGGAAKDALGGPTSLRHLRIHATRVKKNGEKNTHRRQMRHLFFVSYWSELEWQKFTLLITDNWSHSILYSVWSTLKLSNTFGSMSFCDSLVIHLVRFGFQLIPSVLLILQLGKIWLEHVTPLWGLQVVAILVLYFCSPLVASLQSCSCLLNFWDVLTCLTGL